MGTERQDSVIVYVGGVRYEGVMVRDVLRFRENAVIRELCNRKGLDLNAIVSWRLPLRDLAEFWMSLGYSVDGFCELSLFEELEVIAPGWYRPGKKYDGTSGTGE